MAAKRKKRREIEEIVKSELYGNGLTIEIPSPSKSFVFRVTSVRPCSNAVAASRESITGNGRSADNSPQRFEISAVIAMVQLA